MSPKLQSTLLALSMLVLVTFAVIGFVLMGFAHPLPWFSVILIVACAYLQQRVTESKRIRWDDSLSVGIAEIDNDHKRLFELLDAFYTAAVYQKGEAFEQAALKELVDYTNEHFAREEKEMDAHEYPDSVEHKRQHQEMRDKVAEVAVNYGSSSAEELAIYLRDWLNNHIKKTDADLGQFLNQR
ncbi:hemerythrin [Motiliproteus coralliicola]|uniref:Hemerythrin n=1 Tax=Motiliproteus coralliicola TaxID=2283196 RepID=A0A369WMP4_9GAMM|nr:bacteriohemerythrin [Motiliproteus coralliicola]RDE22957.1 hemerythrin [Motiliproteus coralliicola]